MNNKKIISTVFASLLTVVVCLTASKSFAQTKMDSTMMKDCCMMKNGKMMVMKQGKTMPMEKDMTMKNGTKCMTNGMCKMKNGKKMQMKEGQCIDMDGKMDKCEMMHMDHKSLNNMKNNHHEMAMIYTCPMHPEVTSEKSGKCPKCGMDLIEKK